MDHGGHGGHDMPMGPKCSMHMLWNTQIIDTCIIFQQWHVTSHTYFFFSVLAIVGLGVFYEYLRSVQRCFDRRALSGNGKVRLEDSGRSTPEQEDELRRRKRTAMSQVPFLHRLIRAVLYAATVFLSMFLMLVFMTYNAYLILAVVAGAGIGHYVFGGQVEVDSGKGMACH